MQSGVSRSAFTNALAPLGAARDELRDSDPAGSARPAIFARLSPCPPAKSDPQTLPVERSLVNTRSAEARRAREQAGLPRPRRSQATVARHGSDAGRLICSLESDRERKLECVPLEGRLAREFLKILDAHADFPRRKDRICRKTQSVDLIMRCCLVRRNVGTSLICRLPLSVADHPEL